MSGCSTGVVQHDVHFVRAATVAAAVLNALERILAIAVLAVGTVAVKLLVAQTLGAFAVRTQLARAVAKANLLIGQIERRRPARALEFTRRTHVAAVARARRHVHHHTLAVVRTDIALSRNQHQIVNPIQLNIKDTHTHTAPPGHSPEHVVPKKPSRQLH